MTASASPPTTRASVVRASSTSPARAATRNSASRAWTATASAAPPGAVDACGACGGAANAVDVTGKCCVGSLDAGGFCCESGVFDACGVCDGTGETCPVWLEMSVVVPEDVHDAGDDAVAAHLWEWAELALNLSGALPADASAAYLDESARLSGTTSFATSAMAPPPPRAQPPPPPNPRACRRRPLPPVRAVAAVRYQQHQQHGRRRRI